MIWILTLAFVVAALSTLAVIATSHHHARWSADHDLSGPQKMHAHVVPRVGGLGIAAGLVVGVGVLVSLRWPDWHLPCMLLLCAVPAFGFGLIEDFTKAVSPRRRLLAAALSGLLGCWLLDAEVVRTGWGWFDTWLVPGGLLSIALTMFAVAGVINSVNIIDGMNGLASMCVVLSMSALCYIAWQVGDTLVAGLALATLSAVMGFFIWNFPRGLVFLGDGGAYLLGFTLVELGLMLIQRNPAVSPLAPLLLVAYPVFETLFTMYRRRVLQGRPVSQPDGIHLHTLIFRRLTRWSAGASLGNTRALTLGNSRTSPFLWLLSTLAVLPATIWWNSTGALALALVAFVLVYLRIYWAIVRFRTPAWMSAGVQRP